MALTAISFTFYSCNSQPADKTSPDDMVEGTDAGLDSASTATDQDTTGMQ